ncbi:MAG TPA: PAS domain S-box protein [Rhodospirillaceae bacterium]|nr:PAS domain S-box protein [Rhodospirillaceae bacterium]
MRRLIRLTKNAIHIKRQILQELLLETGGHQKNLFKDVSTIGQWRAGESAVILGDEKRADTGLRDNAMDSLPDPEMTGVTDPLTSVARELIRVSEIRYRRLFETALDGILLLNADTAQIEDVNPYLIAMLGYSHAQFLGKKLWEVGPFADIAQSKEMFVEIQTNGHVRYENLPLRTISGRLMQVEFVSNSYDCDGVKVIQCNIRDITDRKNAEKKMTDSNSELEQFAYVASHDLREPLRMISNYLELLERRNPQLSEESKKYLGFAKRGAVRMDHMVLALLELSRVGRNPLPPNPVDSATAIEDAILNLAALIGKTDSDVTKDDQMPIVMGDRGELTRLFQNLIGNAIKYRHSERRSVVHVKCQPCEGGWRFAVTDNGIGISSNYYDRIFQIFQRLHGKDQYEGTGIGLAICKKIVEHHGGKIWVESCPEEGSTFYFTLRNWSPNN